MYCKYLVDFFEKILKKSLTRKGMYVIIIVVFRRTRLYLSWLSSRLLIYFSRVRVPEGALKGLVLQILEAAGSDFFVA